jgi:hypothetical protein
MVVQNKSLRTQLSLLKLKIDEVKRTIVTQNVEADTPLKLCNHRQELEILKEAIKSGQIGE